MSGDYSPSAIEQHPLPPVLRSHLSDEHHDVVCTLRAHEPGDRWSEGVLWRLDECQRYLQPPGQPADGEIAAALGLSATSPNWAGLTERWGGVGDHLHPGQFPDGQLYVNLCGFDPTGEPMQPAEAVRGFLDAFEVPPERIPVNLNAQAALYRSLLADRQMLVVLDNARDTKQVRPLLPGSPSCLVVITSRNRLASLVAQEGARPISLNVLTDHEATALLAGHLGQHRMAAESEAVTALIGHCARLPLALAIVAARAATNPGLPLRALADELQDEHRRLDALGTGDFGTDVRAVLSWSYCTLTPQAAHLLRLLGLHPGPDISLHAAASLAGIPASRVRPLLTELTRAHLLDEHTLGRYRFHDLLRAYAAEQARQEESEQGRRIAVHRLLDYYLHTGFAADRHLYPQWEPITLDAPRPGVTPHQVIGYEQAMDWFTTEYASLIAAIDHAAHNGFDTHAWQLPWTLAIFLYRQGHWHDYIATHESAVAAASRLNDRFALAITHRLLGWAYARLGRYVEALTNLQQALTLSQGLGDRTAQAHTHRALSRVCEWLGHYTEALTHAQYALDLSRATGHHIGEARSLNALGCAHARLGNYRQALTHCQHALDLHRDLGDHYGEAETLDNLGDAHRHLGQYAQATTHYQHALSLYRELDSHYNEAATLTHLGDTHHAADNHPAARDAWRHALGILDQLAHPDAEDVRTKLAELADQ